MSINFRGQKWPQISNFEFLKYILKAHHDINAQYITTKLQHIIKTMSEDNSCEFSLSNSSSEKN